MQQTCLAHVKPLLDLEVRYRMMTACHIIVCSCVRIEEAQTPAQLDMEDGDVRSSVEPLTLVIAITDCLPTRASDHRRVFK